MVIESYESTGGLGSYQRALHLIHIVTDNGIGCCYDVGGASVVVLQLQILYIWPKVLCKVDDVPAATPESVDGLLVVSHSSQVLTYTISSQQQL